MEGLYIKLLHLSSILILSSNSHNTKISIMKYLNSLGQGVFRYILALAVVIGFFYCLTVAITKVLPEANKEMVYMLFGIIAGKFGTIIDHEWGSSASSERKTEIMAEEKKTTPVEPV